MSVERRDPAAWSPVRSYATPAEMRASYAEIRSRLEAKARLARPIVAFPDPIEIAPAPPPPFVPAGPPTRDILYIASQRSPKSFMQEVAGLYGMSVDQLMSRRRVPEVVIARQYAIWLCHAKTHLSLPQIGRGFKIDHTTVLYAIRMVEKRLAQGWTPPVKTP